MSPKVSGDRAAHGAYHKHMSLKMSFTVPERNQDLTGFRES